MTFSCAKKDDGYAPLNLDETETSNPGLNLDSELNYIQYNESLEISFSGGTGPFTFELYEGEGSIDPVTGIYTAPNQPTLAKVKVSDSTGSMVVSQIAVFAPLAIPTENLILHYGENYTVTATGGFESYTFSLVSGAGTLIQNSSITFIAPFFNCNAVVRVTDISGEIKDLNIQIIP